MSQKKSPVIFISYRHDDEGNFAGRLADHLQARFGEAFVFLDVGGGIGTGADFAVAIENALKSCRVFIAVVGKRWLELLGAPRQEKDWVRFEIAAALARPDVSVIPIRVRSAELPGADDLPAELSQLSRQQGPTFELDDFEAKADRLIEDIEKLLTSMGREIPKKRRGDLRAYIDTPPPPDSFDKQVINIAIVLNAKVHYTENIEIGLRETLSSLLVGSPYTPRYESVAGFPKQDDDERNAIVFARLMSQFSSRPHYLVTIGTGVSRFAAQHFRDIPRLFIGVTDPVASGIVPALGRHPDRAKTTGVVFGPPVRQAIDIFRRAFPNKVFGFVYSKEFEQDQHFLDLINKSGSQTWLRIIGTKSLQLPLQDHPDIDILFGRYFVSTNLPALIQKNPLPFVGFSSRNAKRGAVLSVGPDARHLGQIAAKDILHRAISEGLALSDMDVIEPAEIFVTINPAVARKHDLTIHEDVRAMAQRRIG